MRNPIPPRIRRLMRNLAIGILAYLATQQVFAIWDGRAEAPSLSVLIGFIIGSLVAISVTALGPEKPDTTEEFITKGDRREGAGKVKR